MLFKIDNVEIIKMCQMRAQNGMEKVVYKVCLVGDETIPIPSYNDWI